MWWLMPLSRKERVKPKRVRAMNMILHSSIKDRILAAQKEVVDEFAILHKGLDEMIKQRSDRTFYYLDRIWEPLKGEVRTLIMDKSHKIEVLWHTQEMIKWLRRGQMRRAGLLLANPRFPYGKWEGIAMDLKPLDFSVGDYVLLLKGHRWKGVYALEKEWCSMTPNFHVSNLKKCLADPTLQVPLDEIRVDAKLNFVEEPVEILEKVFKKLKRIDCHRQGVVEFERGP
ncbi:hypothetical protein Tco_1090182 [Tanacetum coccineum]|uniref:Reverse transcriptase domain-containing protein n=1 Tax=Tanacetum coccineum TaxID=301880 RepID=A0ABQ5I4R0_9ASTR